MKPSSRFLLFILGITIFLSGKAQFLLENTIILDGQPTNLENLLSKYIQIKSISGSEKEAGEFLKNLCLENGLHVTSMGSENGNYNFTASLFPLTDGLPNIVFLNHIDVVSPGQPSQWKHPPFSGKITETEIWGRGAFDNKGNAIMQLASILAIQSFYQNENLPYNVTLLAVSCEETQCDGGVKFVIDHFLDLINPVVVIGEGPPGIKGVLRKKTEASMFGISVAHKRAFWVKLEREINTCGHGSITPNNYAHKEIIAALNNITRKKQPVQFNNLNVDILKQLSFHEKGLTRYALKHPRLFKPLVVSALRKKPEIFALFSNTITLTVLDGGNHIVNVIPKNSTAILDCRLLPMASRDQFLKHLKKRINNDSIKITVIKEMPKALPSDPNSMFYNHLQTSILENYSNSYVAKVITPNFCDLGAFRAQGIPAFSSVPVNLSLKYIKTIHNIDERIPKNILKEGAKVYADFIKKCMDYNLDQNLLVNWDSK